MFYLKKLISFIFIFGMFGLLYIMDKPVDPFEHKFNLSFSLDVWVPGYISSAMRLLLVFLFIVIYALFIAFLCHICFSDFIVISLPNNIKIKIFITILLFIVCFAFLIAWPLIPYFYSFFLYKCSYYGKILLGFWVYLLYSDWKRKKFPARP